MQRLGNFLAMTLGVGVFLVTVSLVTQQPTSAVDKKAARAFYLTTTMHTGGEVLTACAAGFHDNCGFRIGAARCFRVDSDRVYGLHRPRCWS
jgi:hypothetical protein